MRDGSRIHRIAGARWKIKIERTRPTSHLKTEWEGSTNAGINRRVNSRINLRTNSRINAQFKTRIFTGIWNRASREDSQLMGLQTIAKDYRLTGSLKREGKFALPSQIGKIKGLAARAGNFASERRTGHDESLSGGHAQTRRNRTRDGGRAESQGYMWLGLGNCDDFGDYLRKSDESLRIRAALFKNPTSEPGLNLGLDPFLDDIAELFAQIRNLIQAVELK